MIEQIVNKYFSLIKTEEHHRYKSWEHCYSFFKNNVDRSVSDSVDKAQLHLAFYLASWGMYRGSSFLLQCDYKIHKYAVEIMLEEQYANLYNGNIQMQLDSIMELKERVTSAYVGNVSVVNGEKVSINVTDTLSSKILLGVYGCVPAYDRYFIAGLKYFGVRRKDFSKASLNELLGFYETFKNDFNVLGSITDEYGMRYPAMKLIDMFFWQVGFILDQDTNEDERLQLEKIRDYYQEDVKSESNAAITDGNTRIGAFNRTSDYEIPVIEMVREAVESFHGSFSMSEIKHYIKTKHGDVNDRTINAQVIIATVNAPSRVNWAMNQKVRKSNSKYDFIYKIDRGVYERYLPEKHGVWWIVVNDGEYSVKNE